VQRGGNVEQWHPDGDWVLGGRDSQRVISIKIRSADRGKRLTGTITYDFEGPIGFKAASVGGNRYAVQNHWGGELAPWHDGGTWILGGRPNDRVIALDVVSEDHGETLQGEMTYEREGPIRFKATRTTRTTAREKPPELALTWLAALRANPKSPARSTTYRVTCQTGAETEPWRPAGDWVLGTRDNQPIVGVTIRSENAFTLFKGKIIYAGGDPLGFYAHTHHNKMEYEVHTQWSRYSPFAPAGTWSISGRRGERLVCLDLVSDDGGETLRGSITDEWYHTFRIKATRKPGDEDKQEAASAPSKSESASGRRTLREGVHVSKLGVMRTENPHTRVTAFSCYFDVYLNHRVPDMAAVKGMRIVLDEARGSDGKPLERSTYLADWNFPFRPMRPTFEFENEGDLFQQVGFWLEPGTAKAIARVSGHIELLLPSKDPASIGTASFAETERGGVPNRRLPLFKDYLFYPVQVDALEAEGVKLALGKMRDSNNREGIGERQGSDDAFRVEPSPFWGLHFRTNDPRGKLAGQTTEFFDGRGRKLESVGIRPFDDQGETFWGATFFENPPADTVAKLYLITDKSVVAVPFAFCDVQVPER
jgi:hypothetical protein